MKYTDILELGVHSQEIKDIILFYRDAIESLVLGSLEVCYNDRATMLHIPDVHRLLFEITRDDDYPTSKAASTVHSLIVSMFQDAEKHSPVAGLISILFFADMILEEYSIQDLENDICNQLKFSRLASYKEWVNMIYGWMKHDKVARDIFTTSIHLGGPCSQIHIKKDTSKKTVIESLAGHTLSLGMHEGMAHAVGGYWKASNCRVCLIDGIIENVGEIHHLLEFFNKNKLPLLIAARGFADDVISTLSTNMIRKTLNCMPFVVGVNEQSINTLVDMAVLCGCDVVSSLKGELISTVSPESLPVVDSIVHTLGSLTISPNDNKRAVSFHKSRIEEKKSESHEMMGDYFLDRINFLAGECVNVTLGKEHGDLIGLRHDRIEFLIRVHNIISRFGIVEIEKLRQLNVLSNIGIKDAPAKSVLDGCIIAIKHLNLSRGISHFIIKD